jgi:hypothetical protein
VVIFDLATQVSTMIVPSNQSYMVSTPGWTSPALPLFKISDPENACPDWEKALNKPGTCSKVGDEKLEGRDTVKYRGSSKNGETGYAWVDRKLHLVIKWDGEKRGTELRNIQEGPQSASLFEIPSNYQKVDAKAADQAQRQKQKSARPTAPN